MSRVRAALALSLGLTLALLAGGCGVSEFCVTCATDGDGGPGLPADARPDDSDGGDGGLADAAPPRDGCTAAGEEICNSRDDDCDGRVDEAPVAQVGDGCGTDVGPCTTGRLACTAGELVCAGAVLPQAESCNGDDEDCDGMVDDGDPGGGLVCGDGTGECRRGMTLCSGGEVICENEIGTTPELCDTLDNDCDGRLDEGNPEGGAACGDMAGTCMPGEQTCIGGTLQCVGASGPQIERCDLADNDCDTMVDEDFDLANDRRNCGACGNNCVVPNAQPGCSGRTCTIAFCLTGFYDLENGVADGCEYACDLAGAEVCNGRDDDCDGRVDESLTRPTTLCNSVSECAGTVAICEGAAGWRCNYGPTVLTDADGDIVPETDCDGLDNDCDGVRDDFFRDTLGDPCTRGLGACQTSGAVACNASQDGVVCSAPTPPAGGAETCNGVDDDCDGVLDDGAPDAWVQISGSLWVYQYEASRPDATGASAGSMSHRPCSAAGRLPWTSITHPQAATQCAAVGARLCSEAEWQSICRSSTGTCTWSYQTGCTAYVGNRCNGNDFDFDSGTAGDQDGLVPGGSRTPQCRASWPAAGVFDLSGNVKEWTLERAPPGSNINPLRGGSYNNTAAGISCNFNFTVADDSFQFQNVGFRCCRPTAP